ncbi:MAG: hypothetical protein A2144_12965 [Chloroflexi bacterium RBG_16_50_9]|nr:MAG: hypothetical protein A2144_12965 [Chloroflexi bacterium RBG_16_50_9]
MKDKSLSVLLMLLFGISGLTITMLAWLWPALASERVAATVAGSFGLFLALTCGLTLRQATGSKNKHVPVEVKSENRF